MSILSKFGHPLEFYCDDCGFIFTPQEENRLSFRKAVLELKKMNWTFRSHREKGGTRIYTHQCGVCNGKNQPNPRGVQR